MCGKNCHCNKKRGIIILKVGIMKKSCYICLIVVAVFVFGGIFLSLYCFKDPKSKEYPNIPNSILKEVSEVVTPEMFGASGDGLTDDTEAVQKCLAKYEDKKSVCSLTKTYMCSNRVRVYPNTYVYLSGTLVANSSDKHGISIQLFEYDGDNSNYKNSNITITGGGIIDAKGYDETERYNSMLRMGHGENIVIENISFKNAVRYHAMEITSCKNVIINNCDFEGFYAHNVCKKVDVKNHKVIGPHEFIQIEELDSGGSGGMTPYDNTIPEDITVSNCTFSKGNGEFYKAIGDHGKRKFSYKNIKILNNIFKNSTKNLGYDEKVNASYNCIVGFYTKVEGLLISGNTFENCNTNAICASGSVEIKNNTFKEVLLNGVSVLFDSEITISNNTFENIATQNLQNSENYFSYLKFENDKSSIKINAIIFDNKFKNNLYLSVNLLDCFEYEKSTYRYFNNEEFGNFDKTKINQYATKQ